MTITNSQIFEKCTLLYFTDELPITSWKYTMLNKHIQNYSSDMGLTKLFSENIYLCRNSKMNEQVKGKSTIKLSIFSIPVIKECNIRLRLRKQNLSEHSRRLYYFLMTSSYNTENNTKLWLSTLGAITVIVREHSDESANKVTHVRAIFPIQYIDEKFRCEMKVACISNQTSGITVYIRIAWNVSTVWFITTESITLSHRDHP